MLATASTLKFESVNGVMRNSNKVHTIKPRFTSLFSGCGGFDLGFINAGYSCVAAFDIDKDAISAYKKNIGPHIHEVDLGNFGSDVIQAAASADVLVAGPPCQGFSTVGKNDPNDLRNSLLLKVADIATLARPQFVVIENVRGLLSPRYETYWKSLLKKLTKAGYRVNSRLVEATEFGVPQRRRRVIVIATLGKNPIELNFPVLPQFTLRDALSGVESQPQHALHTLSPDSQVIKIARHIGPGQKLSNVRGGEPSVHTWHIPEVFGETDANEVALLECILSLRRKNRRRPTGDADPVTARDLYKELNKPVAETLERLIAKGYVRKLDGYYDLTNAFNGKFRRLQWDDPAPTVDTRFGQPRYFLHPDDHRGFSVREVARIQGFPDSYCFEGYGATAYRLIGNAVPPPMAKSIAKLIKKHI